MDIGSSSITLMVGSIDGDNIQIVYKGDVPSEGVRYSSIFNPQLVVAPLKKAIAEAEKALNIKIYQVLVGLPRCFVRQINARGELPRADQASCITQEEVDSLKNIALDDYPDIDLEREVIYDAVSQSFSVDDYHQIDECEVVGIVSSTLEGNFKIFSGSKRSSDNLSMVMNSADVAFKTIFTPLTTAAAVLSRDERETGVALIEMGGGVTSVSVYHDNILRYYASIPFGGKSVTADIKRECGLSTPLAENIKLAFGGCMPDKLPSLGDKTIRIDYNDSGIDKQLPVRFLSEIITAREKEIVDAMLWYIQQSGYAEHLRSGIVLTGGAAGMLNLAPMIKEMTGYTVRLGHPLALFSSVGCGAHELDSATTVGMILAAKHMERLNCIEKLPEPEPVEEDVPEKEEERDILVLEAPVAKPEPEPAEKKPKKERKPKEPKERKPKPSWVKGIANGASSFWDILFDQDDTDANN